MMLDARKLSTLLETPEQLLAYLGEMSNAQFRNASRVLGERLLPSVDNDVFWQVFRALLLSDRKAYLGTLLKALVARLCPKGVHPTSEVLDEVGLWTGVFPSLCRELTDTDRKKILLALLLLPPVESPPLCRARQTSAHPHLSFPHEARRRTKFQHGQPSASLLRFGRGARHLLPFPRTLPVGTHRTELRCLPSGDGKVIKRNLLIWTFAFTQIVH